MALVGSAEYLVEATGVQETAQQLQVFAQNVDVSMESASASTESASKAAGGSIVAYAALGAAIGTVFIDFIRSSSVMSTLTSSFGAILGSIADTILVSLVPAMLPLMDALLDFGDWLRSLPDWAPPALAALLLISVGLVAISIAGAPVFGVILLIGGAVLGLITLFQNWQGITVWAVETVIQVWVFLRQALAPVIEWLAGAVNDIMNAWGFLVAFFTAIWDAIQGGFNWFVDNVITPWATLVIDVVNRVRDAWGGIVEFFQGLWDKIVGGIQWFIGAATGFFTGLWDGIVSGFRTFVNIMAGGLEAFVNAFIGGINLLIDGLNAIAGLVGQRIPHIPPLVIPRLETGGEILQTGLAIVHKGEQYSGVGPGAGGFGTTLNMTNYFAFGGALAAGGRRDARDLIETAMDAAAERFMTKVRRRT